MNNTIKVDYDARTRRLQMVYPFYLSDAARDFPSRRFNPRSKKWAMPLTRSNIKHLNKTKHLFNYIISEEAKDAILNYESLMALPKYVLFPQQYDFTESAFAYEPMDHQRKMLDKSWNLKAAAWFAKPGTGKTFAAIHLACARYKAGLIDALMIVCPVTLRTTWQKELAKFATVQYDFRIHESKSKAQDRFFADKSKDKLHVLAVSVEGLGHSKALYDSACGFLVGRRVMLVCDESSRIKNPDAKRTERTINFRDASDYRVILNGTPIALGIQDLWSQYELLDPNIIGAGDYWSFKCRYLTMGGYDNKQIVGVENIEELMRAIEPYTVEVGKDVLNLPPKLYKTRYCQATPEQKALLRLIKKGVSEDPDAPLIKVENVLEKILRYRQVVGGWLPKQDILTEKTTLVKLESNPKMSLMLEIIEDNLLGSKFIIWSPYLHEIQDIVAELTLKYGSNSVAAYYGGTAKEDRSAIEDRYCNDPSLIFLVGNPASAGLGLTFVSTLSDTMIYYSNTNAFIDRTQSEDRCHRIGQTSSVSIFDLVMERTIDEIMIDAHNNKMDVEKYIFDRLAEGEQFELEG